MGRPTDYALPIATSICLRVSGNESLRKICADKEMPGLATVFRWLRDHKEFRDQYEMARMEQADVLADEIVEIADEEIPQLMTGATDSGAVQRNRLRVDARKWVASKLKPKVYGDKLQQEHSGSVSMPVLNVMIDGPKAPS